MLHLPIVLTSMLIGTPERPNTPTDDRWKLVFEDEFDGENDPLADWETFGDAASQTKGRRAAACCSARPGGQRGRPAPAR